MLSFPLAAVFGLALLAGDANAQTGSPPPGRDTALYSADRPVDFLHLDLDLRFTSEGIEQRRCAGRATYTLRPRAPRVDSVRLDAADLKIREIRLQGREEPLNFSYDDRVATVALPATLTPETTFKLEVDYEIVEPSEGMYFILPNASRPDRPVAVYTMGEPLEARHWLPTHDWPNERFTTDMRITVPEGLTAVANGELVSRREREDGGATFHYRHDVPTDPHLLGLAVGDFVEVPSQWRGKSTTVWTQPGLEEAAAYTFRRVPEMLDFYEDLLGVEYPYPSYIHATIPHHHHGGMEHAGFSFMDPKFMATSDDGDWPLETTESIYISHMLAHQWFAGIVNYRSVSEAWLNEGFAILLDSLWTSHTDSPHRFACKMWDSAKHVSAFDTSEDGQPMVNRHIAHPGDIYLLDGSKVYYKGGWVLNMLRHQLGDELFWRAVGEYLRRHEGDAVGTPELRRVLEDVSGRDFEQFFAQWVYGHGVPRLSVDYAWDLERKQVTVTVTQTQKIDAATLAFMFPLDLWFEIDGKIVRKTVDVRDPRQEFRFKFASEPTQFCVDPEGGLLKTLAVHAPRGVLLRQAEFGPTALARLMAVESLAGESNSDVLAVLERVLKDEQQFWMVRKAAAEGLGRQQNDEALAILLRAHDGPIEHPRARAAVVSALGRYFASAPAHEAVLAEAERGDSLEVEMAVAPSLGNLRGGPDLTERGRKTLEAYIKEPSRRAVRERAFGALTELGDARAARTLWAAAQPGADPDDRPHAIRALGRLGRSQPRSAAIYRALVQWLDDPDDEAQAAAAGALGAWGDAAAIDDLVRLRDSTRQKPVRDAASGALAALRRPREPERSLDAVLRRMEAVEAQNRALQSKLDALLKKLEAID